MKNLSLALALIFISGFFVQPAQAKRFGGVSRAVRVAKAKGLANSRTVDLTQKEIRQCLILESSLNVQMDDIAALESRINDLDQEVLTYRNSLNYISDSVQYNQIVDLHNSKLEEQKELISEYNISYDAMAFDSEKQNRQCASKTYWQEDEDEVLSTLPASIKSNLTRNRYN